MKNREEILATRRSKQFKAECIRIIEVYDEKYLKSEVRRLTKNIAIYKARIFEGNTANNEIKDEIKYLSKFKRNINFILKNPKK